MIPLTSIVGLLLATSLSALFQTIVIPRGFGADAIVEEHGTDELEVTENPVEQGASITDHAFKKPARLTLRLGYSNSSAQSLGDPLYVQTVYNLFLLLQAARIPFGLITGKRIYTNLLITSLEQTTNQKWENALLLVVGLKQIILVNTQVVSVPSSSVMSAPGITGATQNLGLQSLLPPASANVSAFPTYNGVTGLF
jgi:hypothetical protein